MKASRPHQFIQYLLGACTSSGETLGKVCGVSTVEAAVCAARAGCDFVGLIFAEKSRRFVAKEKAAEIVAAVRAAMPARAETTLQPLQVCEQQSVTRLKEAQVFIERKVF